ncbi:MAG: 1-acyl-sn-glycerol-3-phosphate acyltransferase, partial [Gammaproteobacteria bacterium]|nr:1-acyl-sn-glycerol-3-phosphate acyltransferase [Gammaproteobacteria bacterium]
MTQDSNRRASNRHSQFGLLKQRRFLPFFLTQALGAFNDNVYRNAMLALIIALGLGQAQVTLYANLAPALFILPYFLFSATAGQIAEKYEKAALIRITTALIPGFGPQSAAIAVIALAIIGHLVSRAIPRAPAAAPDIRIDWWPLAGALQVLRLTRRQRAVRNAVLGVSWFWFVGTVLTAQLPGYAGEHLGGVDPAARQKLYLLALALFSVGVGVGSLLCEKLSARTVEIGLVPLGAAGITVFGVDLYFARPGAAPLPVADIAAFFAQAGSVRIAADLALIGVFAGFFIVPLFALIQSRTPRHELSRVIAGMNIQNAALIVTAAALSIVAQRYLGLTVPQVFLALAVLNALVAAWIFALVPEFLMRFISWLLVKTLYRLRIRGIEHIPDAGPALVVCNHVSYMDALILAGAIPRPVRFVMYHRIFHITFFGIGVMRWIFRTAKAIPIAGAREDRALMERAFAQIEQALDDGEIVGIFPEGALTRDGNIAPFKTGVERILAQRPVPVVP